jgi:DNA-binding transcriptional MerR regulator
MRIGELAGRVGVSQAALRVWERRYGLLHPVRTPGGYRAYTPEDETRVRAVLALRDGGVATRDAVVRVLANERARTEPVASEISPPTHRALVDSLHEAGERFDEASGQAALDTAYAMWSAEVVTTQVLLPYLQEVGERWARGELTIAQEHFASQLIRRRLSPYTLTWGHGTGSLVVLACPAGEWHDVPLLLFGVLLARAGWRVRLLGADTPIAALANALSDASFLVLTSVAEAPLLAVADAVRALGSQVVVWLGGPGATERVARECAARRLSPDMVAAVRQLGERTAYPSPGMP